MCPTRGNRPEALVPHSILKLLIWLFPPHFRKVYGWEIQHLYGRMLRDEKQQRGAIAGLFVLLAAARDVLCRAPVEWGSVLLEWCSWRRRRSRGRFGVGLMAVIQDARYALRTLVKRPGFTAAAVLTLALGIGATTAIFSVVNSILFRPLPIAAADRVVTLCETNPAVAGFCVASPPNVADWSDQSTTFESLGLARGWPFIMQTDAGVEGISGGIATPGFFHVLRFTPHLGRLFVEEDLLEGNNRVVVLSHGMWRSEFGSDASVIGRTIRLDNEPYQVIGVLGPDARAPQMEDFELWAPLDFNPRDEQERGWRGFRTLGRLRDGISLAAARSDMATITDRLALQYPETNAGWGVRIIPLREHLVGSTRPLLLTFLGAVGFVLLIGCANVANLLLARTAGRRRELAVRTALGAERGRLVQFMMGESGVLSLVGAGVGIVLAFAAVKLFVALAPGTIPRLDEVSIDGRALGFAVLVAAVTTLVFGLVPALQAAKLNLGQTLKEGEQKHTDRSNLRLRNALIVSEVTLAVVLLVGAGLLVQSFVTLLSWEPGFDREHLLTVWLLGSSGKYSSGDEVGSMFEQAAEEVRVLPSVVAVGATSAGPLFGGRETGEFVIEGWEEAGSDGPVARWYDVDTGYFPTLGLPLLAGRQFTNSDDRNAPLVAVVNETMAQRYWPGQDPLGRQVTYEGRTMTLVGVVGDVQPFLKGAPVEPEIYWPKRQSPRWATFLVIRTNTDPLATVPIVRDRLQAVDPDMQVSGFATLNQLAGRQLVRPRFNMFLVGAFALVAIALTAVGIYGVVAYSVAQRTQEIGVRVALGAHRGAIVRWVVGKGMGPTLGGLLLGLGGAFAVTRVLASLLYGVRPTDPLTFAVTALFVAGVSLLACYVPAWRATKIDAVVALRQE